MHGKWHERPHALLALLSEGPKYGLQLRQEFEARTGEVWPLNVGQVYTTLQRLERDGLVESDDAGGDGPQKVFRITAAGAGSWPSGCAPRRTLAAAARRAGHQGAGGAAGARGRRRRPDAGPPPAPGRADAAVHPAQGRSAPSDDVGLVLVVDAELFRLDAVVRWLDAADARLAQPPAASPDVGARRAADADGTRLEVRR